MVVGSHRQIFLGVLSDESMQTWAARLAERRQVYAKLRKQYVLDVKSQIEAEADLAVNNPLSQADDVR